jgi:hypothetical protein
MFIAARALQQDLQDRITMEEYMAKKKVTKGKRPQSTQAPASAGVPVSKQTAGGVTGAVLGGVVAGPVGALAGGAVGAMVGDASAKGKRPIKSAVDAIRDEITSGRAKEAAKNVGKRIKSLVKSKKKKKAAASSNGGVKKKKKGAAAPRTKTKRAKKQR